MIIACEVQQLMTHLTSGAQGGAHLVEQPDSPEDWKRSGDVRACRRSRRATDRVGAGVNRLHARCGKAAGHLKVYRQRLQNIQLMLAALVEGKALDGIQRALQVLR